MTSKGAKETLVSKLGFKSNSSSSKVEAELERVRKENSHLRKKMDELAKRHVKPPDSDKSKLLERILSLETMRERNNQQLQLKEQELVTTRQQLSAKGGEVVASLQAQLEQRRQEVEQRDRLFQTLSEESGNLRNKLAAVSARCQVLETPETQNGQIPSGELSILQDQLRDALEKNQQWLVYDQQREAYVQSVVTRTMDLEQQLAQQARQSPQCTSEESSAPPLMGHYEQLLQGTQKDLETQREQAARAQQELQAQREETSRAQAEVQSLREQVSRCQEEMSSFQRRYEDSSRELSSFQQRYEEKSRELDQTKEQLKAERRVNRHAVSDERQVSSERTDRMRVELESMEVRLEEERKRSAELLMQVNMLQKSLLNQNEEQRRIAALEQQIQLSAKEFEDEKTDRQSMQHQLQKMLKELRKARDQITRLESAKPSTRFSEPSSYNRLDFERLAIADSTSPSRCNLLDESFLECPKCRASYPTSQHRELLHHMDYCMA